MAHGADIHDTCVVIDRIDHAIIADADTPEVSGSLELRASGWSGVRCQGLNTRDNTLRYTGVQAFELPAGRPSKYDGVFSHSDAAAGDPILVSSRFPVILVVRMHGVSLAPDRRSLPTDDLVS